MRRIVVMQDEMKAIGSERTPVIYRVIRIVDLVPRDEIAKDRDFLFAQPFSALYHVARDV
jgi:hypothetical protein